MINIVGISGSRVKNGNMDVLVQKALAHLNQFKGASGDFFNLADKTIHGCIHCNWCMKHQKEDKFCVHEDDMEIIYNAVLKADGIIIASPAHNGRLSGMTANIIDRLRAVMQGSLYKRRLKNKIGGAMAVAYNRGGGIETTLQSICVSFLAYQMIVAVGTGPYRYQCGAGAFTTREGSGRFEKEIRHMALEDQFGVAAAEGLVDRMVELSRIFQGSN